MATIIKGKNPKKPYTVRYWIGGKQKERSFTTRHEASDFRAKVEYETRARVFVDPKLSTMSFAAYARQVVDGLAVTDATHRSYRGLLNTWIAPWAGDRTLRQVADDREGAIDLVNRRMVDGNGTLLSYNRRSAARTVMLNAVTEAVRSGRLQNHKLADIQVVRSSEITPRRDLVFPPYEKIRDLSVALESFGPVIWLMRGCGLRIREALAVHREDFRDGGTVLRISGQSSEYGDRKIPLKHRKAGEYRDIPVPAYLWEMVKDKPKGPVCPAPDRLYFSYSIISKRFVRERNKLGISGDFIPHSLRHAFASALLAQLVPITDVAKWLGHRDIAVTFNTYAHLIPSAVGKARLALEQEFEAWRDMV